MILTWICVSVKTVTPFAAPPVTRVVWFPDVFFSVERSVPDQSCRSLPRLQIPSEMERGEGGGRVVVRGKGPRKTMRERRKKSVRSKTREKRENRQLPLLREIYARVQNM